MVKFFEYIGNVWQLIVLTVAILLFLSFVTGVIVHKLRESPMSLLMIIVYYSLIFAFWIILILIGVPAIIRYFISIY